MNIFGKTSRFIIIIAIFGFLGGISSVHAQAVGAALNGPNSVFISGNYAYIISTDSNSLEIVDISDPLLPTHKGSATHRSGGVEMFAPTSVAVSGNYAYVVSYSDTLEVLDVSDPANPIHVSTLFNGDGGINLIRPVSIAISGNYAYIATYGSGTIETIDISDPANPTHVGTYSIGWYTYPSSVSISGDYLYSTWAYIGGGGGFMQIFDITDPLHPIVKGIINHGTDGALVATPTDVYVSGNYAYITSLWPALEIVDVSDPVNPIHKGSITNGIDGAVIFSPTSVFVSGNYAYITSPGYNAFEIVDVSNPASPTHKGKIYDGDNGAALNGPYSVVVSDNNAYIASQGSDAFEIVDVTNPAHPVHKSKLLNGELVGTPAAGCVTDCNSSVMFFPGLEGSRLYREKDNGIEDELWFSMDDDKHELLALDEHGKSSATMDIYTKNDTQVTNEGENETGILDEAKSLNIYKSFIGDLRSWKENEKIIADYAFIPYDWRLSLEDIISKAKVEGDRLSYTNNQDFSESFILQKLDELQINSRTGKVTIVAHSNGGLVTKALVQKLKDTNNPLYDKIDKIIFVAVPQIGTPEGLFSILHGINLGPGGIVMSNERSRQLSENMPGVYNLLPSSSYFTTVDPSFAVDKLISFENKPFFNPQTSQYGVYISNETELKNYVLGSDGRSKPAYEDTIHPNTGNAELYSQTQVVHQALDNWMPHPDTKVIQIAGWGEETLAGLDYTSVKDVTEHLSYKPRYIVDGDGTVVVPSALWISAVKDKVERWWVDLDEYNSLRFRLENFNLKRDHKDILEISNLRRLIESKIKDEASFTDSKNIILDDDSTLISNKLRLHYTLHSPLTLGIMDLEGNYTGMDPITKKVKEEIPDVTYRQIGEVQFLSVPAGVAYTLKMQGYDEGSFSLDVDKQEGNTITDFTSFEGIPSSVTTTAMIDITSDTSIANTVLKIDQDGDEITDFNLNANPGGIVTMPKPLIVTADNKTMTLGSSTPPLTATFSGFDDTITNDMTGTINCTTTASNISPVGTYPITCVIGSLSSNNYYFKTFVSGTLKIVYGFSGFSQPINDTKYHPEQSPSVFKGGSTIPVKFQLKKSDGSIVQSSSLPQWLSYQKGLASSSFIDETVYSLPATTGSDFKWDLTSQQYIYNWNTKGIASGYWYKIFVKLDDSNIYSVTVGLR